MSEGNGWTIPLADRRAVQLRRCGNEAIRASVLFGHGGNQRLDLVSAPIQGFEAIEHREGLRYVHSANEPDLIAGVGTYALEIFDQLPDFSLLFRGGGGKGDGRNFFQLRDHAVFLAACRAAAQYEKRN